MIEKEAQLPEGDRMDFVSIVTPNHMHFPPAKMALENGFHVLSDKPATFDLAESKALEKIVDKLCFTRYGLSRARVALRFFFSADASLEIFL